MEGSAGCAGSWRARAGTLSCRVKSSAAGVATVGALPLGFQVKLGLVRCKYVPAGLHVSASSLSAFRAAVVRAVCSSKMPLVNTPAVLNLLDGPVGVDPALHIIWVRFRLMRRYLADCPDEEPRIFRMLDLISRGAQGHGHGPVHLLLISAAEHSLRWAGHRSFWAPACQDQVAGGHAGVGVVSFGAVPLALLTLATAGFLDYFEVVESSSCHSPCW